MSYRYELSRTARNYLRRLDRRTQLAITALLEELCLDPLAPQLSAPLHGTLAGLRRARFGQHRIVFRVEDDRLMVVVIRIGPRGDIYKG